MNTTSIAAVRLSVEVVTLPVSDVERALRFYVQRGPFISMPEQSCVPNGPSRNRGGVGSAKVSLS
jgi:hypothetical protein